MRRAPQIQWRYLRNANSTHLEVHDLDNEHTGINECQINEIITAGHAYYVEIANNPTALQIWFFANPSYDGCRYCLPAFDRK